MFDTYFFSKVRFILEALVTLYRISVTNLQPLFYTDNTQASKLFFPYFYTFDYQGFSVKFKTNIF